MKAVESIRAETALTEYQASVVKAEDALAKANDRFREAMAKAMKTYLAEMSAIETQKT